LNMTLMMVLKQIIKLCKAGEQMNQNLNELIKVLCYYNNGISCHTFILLKGTLQFCKVKNIPYKVVHEMSDGDIFFLLFYLTRRLWLWIRLKT
ncbi:hypothetical protein BUE63_14725, partial [Bacillus sp. MB353a]